MRTALTSLTEMLRVLLDEESVAHRQTSQGPKFTGRAFRRKTDAERSSTIANAVSDPGYEPSEDGDSHRAIAAIRQRLSARIQARRKKMGKQ